MDRLGRVRRENTRYRLAEGQDQLFPRNSAPCNLDRKVARSCISGSVDFISIVALFIIACVATAGKFPTPTLGWTVVGLSSTLLISQLINFHNSSGKNEKKLAFLTAVLMVAFITLGALGGTGIITARQVGQGMLGAIGVSGLINFCDCDDGAACSSSRRPLLYNESN